MSLSHVRNLAITAILAFLSFGISESFGSPNTPNISSAESYSHHKAIAKNKQTACSSPNMTLMSAESNKSDKEKHSAKTNDKSDKSHRITKSKSIVKNNSGKTEDTKGDSGFNLFIPISIVLFLSTLTLTIYVLILKGIIISTPLQRKNTGNKPMMQGPNDRPDTITPNSLPTANHTEYNTHSGNIPTATFQESKSLTKESTEEILNGFADINDFWCSVGVSVIGNGHTDLKLPCQDNHGYLNLGNGWAIAVVSDGAGSARLSQTGSKIVVGRTIHHFKKLIEEKDWIKQSYLPGDDEWNEYSYITLRKTFDDLKDYATTKGFPLKDLNATAIVVISSPSGLLASHIGDGRAGYKSHTGTWLPLLTPHKGEEANQTVFITSDIWNNAYLRISGVRVPESRVIREAVQAYTLMSDGCENTCWECNKRDKATGKYFDPNLPYDRFFEPLVETLTHEADKDNYNKDDILKSWYSFVKEGSASFKKEVDDKTLLLSVKRMSDGIVS